MRETAPRLVIDAIELRERPVRLRMPFRFGVVTLTEAPQVFARVRVRMGDETFVGMAGEMMAPKWFDKNPALSNEDNFDQLRTSLDIACENYLDGEAATAFGHFARHYREQLEVGAELGLGPLVANYGPALIDRAVLDGLCRALQLPFHAVVRRNLVGICASALCPDLAGFDFDAFLAQLQPAPSIEARHTVGLVDPLVRADQAERVGDGLPETLEEVVAAYGHRWFKLKVGGDLQADLERLARIAEVLDRCAPGYRATLDGNEQYDDIEGVLALWRRMLRDARLATLCRSIAFIEQPIKRKVALVQHVGALAQHKPVIIDESDDTLGAFVRARAMGYTGVSSKTCKGLYKSILNRARCQAWNAEAGEERYFMSAEDLTLQAGVALQQDLALVSLLGLAHVERNGQHYVNGMADQVDYEQQAFLDAHPDLYEASHGAVRVRIADGRLAIGSLARMNGFATGAFPDWRLLQPLARSTA